MKEDFDVDHIHPQSKFGKDNNDNRFDTIPNLQLLVGEQNKSKNDLVTQLQVAFEQGKIEILNEKQQLSELSTYTAEYNLKTKNISYNAPLGLKDDICIAVMLAYDAYKNGNLIGVYNVR